LTGHTAIAVAGPANLDLLAYAPRRAVPGETVMGTGFEQHPGGKGLNQASAAATAADTAFVGCCGDDDAAVVLRESLDGNCVDTTYLTALPGDLTKVAQEATQAAARVIQTLRSAR
jgi:ribokinase